MLGMTTRTNIIKNHSIGVYGVAAAGEAKLLIDVETLADGFDLNSHTPTKNKATRIAPAMANTITPIIRTPNMPRAVSLERTSMVYGVRLAILQFIRLSPTTPSLSMQDFYHFLLGVETSCSRNRDMNPPHANSGDITLNWIKVHYAFLHSLLALVSSCEGFCQ